MTKFDWYAEYAIRCKNDGLTDVDNICSGTGMFFPVESYISRLELLAGALHLVREPKDEAGKASFLGKSKQYKDITVKDYATAGDNRKTPSHSLKDLLSGINHPVEKEIGSRLESMDKMGIRIAEATKLPPNLAKLCWFLNFKIKLAKPYLSRDDKIFYIIENPILKERVFSVPMIPDSSWKGNLRWTMMKVRLQDKKDDLTSDKFADERLRHALLFGTEQGSKKDDNSGFAEYLDTLRQDAQEEYQKRIKEKFPPDSSGISHHRGRLQFYPTFFNRIQLYVINPHKRKEGSGSNPVYMEGVPEDAAGTFSLLYFPFDLIGQKSDAEIRKEALEDLKAVVDGLQAMMLTYGFSAKKTSGYGRIQEQLAEGMLVFAGKSVKFNTFADLKETFNKLTSE